MSTKDTNQKKKDNFIKYWETRRSNRLKYSIIQSLYFVIPFSLIFQLLENVKGFFTLNFAFKFITIFSVYFLLTYYITYNIHEKKFKKHKNLS